MSLHTQHPISIATNSRIDIFHCRRQDLVMDDAMCLIDQTLPTLEEGSRILLLNSLCEHEALARSVDPLVKGQKSNVIVYSACGSKLREKLDLLATTITAKKVRMIILNSWEFAAMGSRQKHALASWLREMRDTHRLRIAIYTNVPEMPKFGALSDLAFAAASISYIGSWKYEDKYVKGEWHDTATEAAERYAWTVIQARNTEAAEATSPKQPRMTTSGMTMPRKKWQGVLNIQNVGQMLKEKYSAPAQTVTAQPQLLKAATEMLKTNDLAGASAHPALVEEEAEDYAMAA